jgi:hypothetical protein
VEEKFASSTSAKADVHRFFQRFGGRWKRNYKINANLQYL